MKEFLKKIGIDFDNPMFRVTLEYLAYVMNYDSTINYLSGSITESMENLSKQSINSLIEPVILPSVSSSILISMYGDFEFYLYRLCEAYRQNYAGINLKYSDINGLGIERAVIYLEKVIGIKGIKQSKEWGEIKEWNQIRNALVHKNGFLKDKAETSAKKLGLKLNENYEDIGVKKLVITLENCIDFCQSSTEFFILCINDEPEKKKDC